MSISNKRGIELIIFSVEQADISKAQNAKNTEFMQNHIEMLGIDFKRIIGSYKGQLENSFIVAKKEWIDNELFVPVFDRFNQESILRLKTDNQAELVYNNGDRDIIGYLKRVTPAEAMQKDAYSLDGNSAYIIESLAL